MLKSSGVSKGDVVTIYMPMTPDIIYTMLACARIGAVHSVVFAGFSADALADRIKAARSRFVVTADEGLRGSKKIPLNAYPLQLHLKLSWHGRGHKFSPSF